MCGRCAALAVGMLPEEIGAAAAGWPVPIIVVPWCGLARRCLDS